MYGKLHIVMIENITAFHIIESLACNVERKWINLLRFLSSAELNILLSYTFLLINSRKICLEDLSPKGWNV